MKASLYVNPNADIGVEKHHQEVQNAQCTAIGAPQSTLACEPYCSTENDRKSDIDTAVQGR